MRGLAVLVLLIAACTNNSPATTTTIDPLPPPPNPDGPTTTTEQAPPPTFREPATATYSGAFPDGVPYVISIEGVLPEDLSGISGVVIYEGSSGPIAAAQMVISLSSINEYSYQDGVYRVPGGGGGSFALTFYDHVLEELGPESAGIIQSSISGNSASGMPVLILDEPFRWATPEDELPVQMEVMYETFVVQKGCDEIAIACSDSRGAQIIPLDRVSSPAPPFEGESVFINSPAPRLRTDPNYLDRGPFTNLDSPNVFWTGTEMVVWGGSSISRGNPQQQGAAYDPQTNQWRLFDGPGLDQGTPSLGLWTDDAMMLITPFATYVGDPVSDDWSQVGAGISMIQPYLPVVELGGQVYVRSTVGIVTFRDGEWSSIPHPGFAGRDPQDGYLLDFGGNLVVTGINQACGTRETAIWTGEAWSELAPIPMPPGACSAADQSAVVGGELVYWGDFQTSYRYDAGILDWVQEDEVPIDVAEGVGGGLVIDGRLLVPGSRRAAIFDAETRSWTEVDLPGFAWSEQMVWTGTEILAWIGYGTYGDAWRWTPPE